MALSSDLLSQFVKITNNKKPTKSEATVYGTTVEYDGTTYVKLDGSELLTPISTTTDVKNGERVTVSIKNHSAVVTGNVSSPSARTNDVKDLGNQISDFEIVIANKVDTIELVAERARIDELIAENVTIKGDLVASNAKIEDLEADNVVINETLIANEATIQDLKTNKLDATIADITYATITELDATNATIYNLEATFGDFEVLTTDKFTATDAIIENLKVEKISAKDIEGKFANIDFANIGEAAFNKIFAESGLIKDLIVGDGTITGELIGVTIKGDLIEAGTLKADRLVIKGNDGNYYRLNTDFEAMPGVEPVEEDAIHGSTIIAESITASKIKVEDLVAFGATIGGFKITDNAIHSTTKASIDNTTRGIYLDNDGQAAIGDSDDYIRYYQDSDGSYKLEISADTILFGSDKKNLEDLGTEAVDDVIRQLAIVETTLEQHAEAISLRATKQEVQDIEVGGRNLILKSDFSDQVSNDAIEFNPVERMITFTSTVLRDTKGVYPILSEYALGKLRNSTITFSGEYKITTALEYGVTNPWVGFQLGVKRDSTTGGNSQYCNCIGGTSAGTAVMDTWEKVTATYDITDYDFTSADISILFRDVIGSVSFRNLKIEFGNKATDWSPAPEDMATSSDIDRMDARINLNSSAISELSISTEGIAANVSKMEQTTAASLESVNTGITTLSQRVEAKVSAEDVSITVQKELENGTKKVVTETGFVFDDVGLTVEKAGTEMKTQITEDGMTVYKNEEAVLKANNTGVDAVNLHASTYLIVGKYSRFEDFGTDRTGCFWVKK